MKHTTLLLLFFIGKVHAASLYDELEYFRSDCIHIGPPYCVYIRGEPGKVVTYMVIDGSVRLMHEFTSDGYAAEEGLNGGCARIFRTSRPEDGVYISPKTNLNMYPSLKECAEAKEW